jgi:hypothetical protein
MVIQLNPILLFCKKKVVLSITLIFNSENSKSKVLFGMLHNKKRYLVKNDKKIFRV